MENLGINSIKSKIRKIPGIQPILNMKGRLIQKIAQIPNLANLIHENRYVYFPSDSGMGNMEAVPQWLLHEIIKERGDLYGIVRLKKSTAVELSAKGEMYAFFTPLALLRIPATHEEYISGLCSQSRNKIKKSEHYEYEFSEFNWNDHLDEIYQINTSKEVRQGAYMRGWYREPVLERDPSEEELQYYKYYGAFKGGILVAYLHFWKCGQFAVTKHVIGHADHLRYGIMNGLIAWTVQKCILQPDIRLILYGAWLNTSLGEFKKHAGFQEYAVILNFSEYPLIKDYLKQKSKSIWRV